MEAIDATYQTVPLPVENKQVANNSEESFVEDDFFVENNGENFSFEELITSMCDDEMASSNQMEAFDEEFSLAKNILADEDVNSIIDEKANNSLQKKVQNTSFDNILLPQAEEVVENIPFIDKKIDVLNSDIEKKDLKVSKEKKLEKEESKNVDTKNITTEHENIAFQNVQSIPKKKNEDFKKVEVKKDEEIKVEHKTEGMETVALHKQKKVQQKKLPIIIEDLRTVDAEKTMEELSSEYGDGGADLESYSGYSSDAKKIASSSNELSFAKENMQGAEKGQFSSMLAEQIKMNKAELVESGKIVLRDGNLGEIRLQLKPEHLGNVRIQLKLTGDKKLQGDVLVSSKEAYEAFDDSMSELVASFKDAGFDTSSFNLNWHGSKKDEILRENLSEQYFSPEKTHLTLSEKLKMTENRYRVGQAEKLNVLA